LVFISHDGRDGDLAELFANLLTDVSGGTLKSFRSSDRKGSSGIEFGAEWFRTIMSKLGSATDVVALLTQHSLDRPWILYEAGVAKGKLDTTVFGVAIGILLEKVSSGPFAQFQNCSDDEDSLTKLMLQLVSRNPNAAPRQEAIRQHVCIFREAIKPLLQKRSKQRETQNDYGANDTAVVKIFEEVKVMFRNLPEALADHFKHALSQRTIRKGHRFHPIILQDLLFAQEIRNTPSGLAIGLLMLVSVIREEVPWVYEGGIDLYRALLSADSNRIESAAKGLISIIEMTTRVPRLEESFGIDHETHMMLYDLPGIIKHLIDSYMVSAPRKNSAITHNEKRPNSPE
jgi:hypothetical protein